MVSVSEINPQLAETLVGKVLHDEPKAYHPDDPKSRRSVSTKTVFVEFSYPNKVSEYVQVDTLEGKPRHASFMLRNVTAKPSESDPKTVELDGYDGERVVFNSDGSVVI